MHSQNNNTIVIIIKLDPTIQSSGNKVSRTIKPQRRLPTYRADISVRSPTHMLKPFAFPWVELCQAHYSTQLATPESICTDLVSYPTSATQAERSVTTASMIWFGDQKAGIPAVKEPHGLSRSDGKRPGGLTLIPCREGHCVTCDVTVIDTVARSHLPTSQCHPPAQRLQPKLTHNANTANTTNWLNPTISFH